MNKKVVCKCKQYKKQIEELKTIIEDLKAQYNTADVRHANFINDLVKEPVTSDYTQKTTKSTNEHPIDYTGILKDDTKWVDPFNKHTQKPKFDLDMFNDATKFSLDMFNEQFEKQKTTCTTDVLFLTDPLTSRNMQKPYNPNLLPIKHVSGREKFDLAEFNRRFEKLN